MQRHPVGDLEFEFDDDWKVGKPDEWAYYRRQFQTIWEGIRAVDLMAIAPDGTLWLIEVKDYLKHRRTNPEPLDEVIGRKSFGTLAMLLPASLRANNQNEKDLARDCLRAGKLQVVFHLEQPDRDSKLSRRAFDLADVQAQLRRRVHPMAPHPKVVESVTPMPWRVRRVPKKKAAPP